MKAFYDFACVVCGINNNRIVCATCWNWFDSVESCLP